MITEWTGTTDPIPIARDAELRSYDSGPKTRIQELGPETQDPQNRTDNLELMIEDLRSRIQT